MSETILDSYITYNKNYLYNNINPFISSFKIQEFLNKESNKLKLPRVVIGPDNIRYMLNKQFKLTSTFSLPETSESETETKEERSPIIEEFISSKMGEIKSNMEKFKKIGLIPSSNISDVKFGIQNICAFIAINLALCQSMKIEEDAMIKSILVKIK